VRVIFFARHTSKDIQQEQSKLTKWIQLGAIFWLAAVQLNPKVDEVSFAKPQSAAPAASR
jgi:hypothetical protein